MADLETVNRYLVWAIIQGKEDDLENGKQHYDFLVLKPQPG